MKFKKSLCLAVVAATSSLMISGPAIASPSPTSHESRASHIQSDSEGYVFVPFEDSFAPTPKAGAMKKGKLAAKRTGTLSTNYCDRSQLAGFTSINGPAALSLSASRSLSSQGSLSVSAGVSNAITAQAGINATFQGMGATASLSDTVTASLSTTFSYAVTSSETMTASASMGDVPAGKTWSISAYPAYAQYSYSLFSPLWKGGKSAIAAGQLWRPVGYCFKANRPN